MHFESMCHDVPIDPASEDRPRSMRDVKVRLQRKAMLHLPHMTPLTAYAAELRRHCAVEVPDFDPMDGGVDARALFLFESLVGGICG